MNLVFDVYQHSDKGAWGFCPRGSEVMIAEIKLDGTLKLETINAIKLGGALTAKVRMGYSRAARCKYLHRNVTPDGKVLGEFSEVHPDLDFAGDGELVLMVTRSIGLDVDALLQEWEVLLQGVDGVRNTADVWIARQRRAVQYFTAPDTHPAFALVLSNWAVENKPVVIAQSGQVPAVTPKNDPMAWKQFLSKWFAEATTQRTLEQLRWSLRDAMLAAPVIHNNTYDADGWIADASQAAF